jgi:PX domain
MFLSGIVQLLESGVIEEDRLPVKKWLSSMSRQVITERRALLQDYLDWLMNTPALVDHRHMQEFMKPVYHHPSAVDTADDEMGIPVSAAKPTQQLSEHELVVVGEEASHEVAAMASMSHIADSGRDMFSWETRLVVVV